MKRNIVFRNATSFFPVYDAWGNCQILVNGVDITDNSEYNTHIAKVNPFRYRGYYFDTETGLYYLNSRYYDPQTRRFINADDPSIPVLEQVADIGGLNLYSYCLNNPVNMADPNGNMPDWLKWVIGGVIIVGLGVATWCSAGATLPAFLTAIASVFSTTMATSGLAAASAGAFVGATLFAAGGIVAGGLISQGNGGSFADGAADGFMWGAIIGAVVGGAWGGLHYNLQAAGKMAVKVRTDSLILRKDNPLTDEGLRYWRETLTKNKLKGYNKLPNQYGDRTHIDVFKASNTVSNGHHRIYILAKSQAKYVNIYYV